ncbi:MAG: preprotein translocase subunit SecG [bacterium]
MYTLLIVVYTFICFALAVVILLQSSKGGGLAGAFGGAGGMGAVFGGRGAATFLSRMTTVLAVAFLSISLIIALLTKGTVDSGKSLVEQERGKMRPAAGLPMVPTENTPQLLPVTPDQTTQTSSDTTP